MSANKYLKSKCYQKSTNKYEQVPIELPIALKYLNEKLPIMEEVDDPVDSVDNMYHPGEVVDDVEEGVLVLDRLDGLVRVEDEEEEQHEQVQEAENGAPIAPESRSKNQNILEKRSKAWKHEL